FEGLNEISWGTREGCRVTPEEDAYYWDVLGQWAEGNTSLRIEGGESPEDVYKRQVPVLEYILNKKDEKNILICMHGRAMRILLCNLLNYPLCEMDVFEHTNLCLYKLRYTGTMCTVELFNETSHLEILNRL
ncbi:MAG: histidine phosphatase family protein, partial [Cyclobacteriaceae bacterium]|nr:histidine phosphatase family protein [Cyclobacteriaceae bacterium]